MKTKQVIVLRLQYPDGKGGTFKPRTGKLIAQAAHASMKVFFDRNVRQPKALPNLGAGVELLPMTLEVPLTEPMVQWVYGKFTKIAVGVDTEEDLLEVHRLALEAGLPTALIEDAGLTEFHGVPTKTAVAVGPAESDEIDKITGPQGKVRVRLL